MTGIVRNGASHSDRNDIPYHMSLSGMLLNSGDGTFQCVVSGDMSVLVGTFTDNTGGPAMMIAQKRGVITSYSIHYTKLYERSTTPSS